MQNQQTELDKLAEILTERHRVIFEQHATKSDGVTGALIALKEIIEAIHEVSSP